MKWNGRVAFTTFIIVFGSSFQFGYTIGVLNLPGELVKEFCRRSFHRHHGVLLTDYELELMLGFGTGAFIPGGMIGAPIGGYLADKYGRKQAILFSHIFAVVGALLAFFCYYVDSIEMLFLGRLVVGMNAGMGNAVVPLFLTEIVTPNLRGALGTCHQLFITIGILWGSILGFPQLLSRESTWCSLFLFYLVPVITSVFVMPAIPETPRYLLFMKKDESGAQKSLAFYRNSDDVDTEMKIMKEEHADQEARGTGKPFTFVELFTPNLIRPLAICCMLQAVQQFSGINAVFFYSQKIFAAAKVSKFATPFAVSGTNLVNVIVSVVSVYVMDIAGRRVLLLIPMVGMALTLALLMVTITFEDEYTWLATVSIILVIFYVICFAIGLGPIPMMIGAELFQQEARPMAMTVSTVVNLLCTFIVAMSFGSVQKALGVHVFLIFIACLVVSIIVGYFVIPETKNKSFEEIAQELSGGKVAQSR